MTLSSSARLSAIAFSAFIHQLTEVFIGRSHILNKIDHWLQQNNQRFFILTGEPGVGKSAIAAHLIQTRKDIFAYHFCQADDPNTLKPGQILRSPSLNFIHPNHH